METENKIISHLYISKEDGQYVIQTNEEHQKEWLQSHQSLPKNSGFPIGDILRNAA